MSPRPPLASRRSAGGSRGAGQEKGLGGQQVFFGVDADRRLLGLDGDDGDVRLEEAQLLEPFGPLERRGRQAMELLERDLAIRVEPDVLVAGDADAIAVVGDRVLREVERAVVGVADDLVHGPARDLAQDLARQPRRLQARRDDPEDGQHQSGKVRIVRSIEARRSPSGAKGTTTGIVSPARANAARRSRQNASGPTTPSWSSSRGESFATAPARSPAFQAASAASMSSAKPLARK